MPYPPKTERNKKIVKLKREGETIYEIAEKEGISAPRVYKILKRWGDEFSDEELSTVDVEK